jgi:hypothetical protein
MSQALLAGIGPGLRGLRSTLSAFMFCNTVTSVSTFIASSLGSWSGAVRDGVGCRCWHCFCVFRLKRLSSWRLQPRKRQRRSRCGKLLLLGSRPRCAMPADECRVQQ